MERDESLQVTDERRVGTKSKLRLEQLLLRCEVELVETHRLETCPIVLSELLKCRPPPTCEGALEQFSGLFGIRGGVRSCA
jgi:hypothetical protein